MDDIARHQGQVRPHGKEEAHRNGDFCFIECFL
jgi:hypothetical protein